MSSLWTWTCFTCEETFLYEPWAPEGMENLPKKDEAVGDDETEVPVAIRYQCNNCLRFARYHHIEGHGMDYQVRFRSFVDKEEK